MAPDGGNDSEICEHCTDLRPDDKLSLPKTKPRNKSANTNKQLLQNGSCVRHAAVEAKHHPLQGEDEGHVKVPPCKETL